MTWTLVQFDGGGGLWVYFGNLQRILGKEIDVGAIFLKTFDLHVTMNASIQMNCLRKKH